MCEQMYGTKNSTGEPISKSHSICLRICKEIALDIKKPTREKDITNKQPDWKENTEQSSIQPVFRCFKMKIT